MTAMNPLLDTLSLPRFGEISPQHVAEAIDSVIADHRAAVRSVVADSNVSFADTWLPLERAASAIDGVWSVVSHLHNVADTPEMRTEYRNGQQRLVDNALQYLQNRDVYDALVALTGRPDFLMLSEADRAAVTHQIRDFKLSGVGLDEGERARFAAISTAMSALSTAFGNAVLDATQAWFEHVTDEALLAGIGETDKAMFADAARERGLDGWAITLQQPGVNAALTFGEDRGLRERIYTSFGTRASDQGPHAGQFDNARRMSRILELRREAAALLGFDSPVAWSLATKMAASADQVLEFLRDLATRAKPAAEREIDELRAYAADALAISELQPWDIDFVSNQLRQARYSIDQQEVKAHFPVERVIAGWQNLLKRLFVITLVERIDVVVYHRDARYYDVVDENDQVLAGVYLDLHARPGKRGGAWMAQARPRLNDGHVSRVPVAYLVCNFAPKGDEAPSLLSHNEIVTFLHETGHCLHHLFTRVDRPNIAGTSGIEWDAVELPSQLMEDFAWDRDVLTDMSGHYETGSPLPNHLFDRLVAARHFLSGMFVVRQIEFALFDLLLHLGGIGSDPMEVIEAVRDEVAVVRPPAWHRFPHTFTHIFAGAYASGYYSYLWAEVLAADGFQRFVDAGLIAPATASLFREEVLARGASRPAADSFRAFRGRDPNPKAILERYGLANADASSRAYKSVIGHG